jgi:phosphoglycolate phosphatase-like HAD superfamily hydrolase
MSDNQAKAERDEQRKAANHWMAEANKEHNENERLKAERDAVREKYEKMMRTTVAVIERNATVKALEAALEIAVNRPKTEAYALLEKSGARDIADAIQALIDTAKDSK